MNDIVQQFQNATISLPVVELALLIVILSVCLVVKLPRFGLIAAYLFIYRWGLLFCLRQSPGYLVFYLIFGFAIGLGTVVGMMIKPSPSE